MRILKLAALVIAFMIPANEGLSSSTEPERCEAPIDGRNPRELWTSMSWSWFDRRDYEGTIENIRACIDNWAAAAENLQDTMNAKGTNCPPVGPVDAATRRQINENAVINDVAANYWLLGRSSESLGRKEEAKRAYRGCAKLRCARIWDRGGWYWDAAADCSKRLKELG